MNEIDGVQPDGSGAAAGWLPALNNEHYIEFNKDKHMAYIVPPPPPQPGEVQKRWDAGARTFAALDPSLECWRKAHINGGMIMLGVCTVAAVITLVWMACL